VFRIYHSLTLNGYSNFINAVKRQRNLGLLPGMETGVNSSTSVETPAHGG
jgi:hypothetical protein